MHTVKVGPISRTLPSTWNELTREQLLKVSSLFNTGTSVSEFKVRLLFSFLKIKNKVFQKIDPVDIYFLTKTMNFFLDEVSLTKSLIPSVHLPRFPWTKYYGPGDGMAECTFGEFTKAQVRYEEYNRTKDPAFLDELVAILYRPKKWFWIFTRHFLESTDCRIRFMDRSLKSRSMVISRLDHKTKYAVFLFFSGVCACLPEKFPNVYRSKNSSNVDSLSGWANLIISLADGKTDDDSLNKIMDSKMYNVFFGLEHQSIKYFDFLKNNPKNE